MENWESAMRHGRANKVIAGLAGFVASLVIAVAACASDPRMPPGKHLGGIPVAIVGHGLDYRRPDIAQRLARDGEGEAIAWDFSDNDARPFSAEGRDQPLAAVVLAEGQAATLILTRTAAGAEAQIAAALRFIAETPARIALVAADPGRPIARAHLAAAARQLPRLLLIVPARHVSGIAEPSEPGGLLVVGAGEDATPHSDVASTLESRPGSFVEQATAAGHSPDDISAARVAALAARLLAIAPDLAGQGLKSKVLSFAKPNKPGAVPHIPAIARIHWLE